MEGYGKQIIIGLIVIAIIVSAVYFIKNGSLDKFAGGTKEPRIQPTNISSNNVPQQNKTLALNEEEKAKQTPPPKEIATVPAPTASGG